MTRLAVSIVTYHTPISELELCLQALHSDLVETIYIIDNSNESYIAQFCEGKEKVQYIGGENVGYGAGHNKALRRTLESNVPYHLVMNSDIYFEPRVLDEIVAYMDSNPDVAQVHPKVLNPDGTLQYTVRMLPTPTHLLVRRFMPRCLQQKINYRYLLQFANHDCEMNVPYHQGSFLFFRTDSLREVGLFDERFFMYPEDIDITRRMHRHYRTMYYPAVSIVHDHRAASYKSVHMLYIHIVNMIRYFNKWGWIFDSERISMNKKLLQSIASQQSK